MEALIVKALKFIIVTVIGLSFSVFLLLLSRIPLCYDIEESTGRKVFKNKRKKNKVYPNRIRWFFLWDYLPHIKKWHYAFFLLDVLFSFVVVVIITIIIMTGWDSITGGIGKIIFLILMLIKIIISFFPRGKHQKKRKHLS